MAAVAGPSVAQACSLQGPIDHQLDPAAQETDHVAPTLATPTLSQIQRGKDGPGTCRDIGMITISVTAMDDAAPRDQIGFRLSLVSGSLPRGMTLPTIPIRAYLNTLELTWTDDASVRAEAFSFILSVVAVDLAGNESAAQTVAIQGDGAGGCTVAGASSGTPGAVAAALAALIAAAYRSRRRGQAGFAGVTAAACSDR